MKKLGFIGFGNMAYAIAKGILMESIVSPENIYVYDISENAMQIAEKCGLTITPSPLAVAECADIIFLCVKPQGFTQVLHEISDKISEKVYVSIAAGITISNICSILCNACVIRAMPNTPLLLASGTTALTKNQNVSNSDFDYVKNIFCSVGTVYELPENKFNEVININGSTPAYIYLFAKIIASFAQENGIAYDIAINMFSDTLIGSAKMLKTSGKDAQELIDMVSSKGGTTVAALEAFKETGFECSLRAGMQAALTRAVELGKLD